jgi:tetratricopeptide (TPR) repeat protein
MPDFLDALGALVRAVDAHPHASDGIRAVVHYNVGRQIGWRPPHVRENARTVLHHFRMALRFKPSYRRQWYFWRELGAIAFENSRAGWAAIAYGRALELGAPVEVLALHADALTYAGAYDEAAASFDRYLAAAADSVQPHWRMKAAVMPHIRLAANGPAQRRDPAAATSTLAAVSVASGTTTRSVCSEVWLAALMHDALFSPAWFARGIAAANAGDIEEAFKSFAIAAAFQRDDVAAWANAVLAGLQLLLRDKTHDALFAAVLEAGFGIHQAELYRMVAAKLREALPAALAEDTITLLQDALSALPPASTPREVRLHGTNGEVERFALP